MNEHLNDGTLTALLLGEEDESATRHVSTCAGCLAEKQQMQAALSGYGEWVRAASEHSEGFWARQRSAILECTQQRAARTRSLVWAGATVALVFAAILLTPAEPPAPAAPNISEWRSPTESLLRSPASDFLSSTPKLGESYFPLKQNPQKVSKPKGENNES